MAALVRRLLSAAILCLSVVLSQMAHASVPLVPMVETQSAHSTHAVAETVDEDGVHADEASGQDHGKAGHSKASEHTGPSDTKCASHCPSVFVPTGTDLATKLSTRQALVQLVPVSLTGLPGPTADRPPRI